MAACYCDGRRFLPNLRVWPGGTALRTGSRRTRAPYGRPIAMPHELCTPSLVKQSQLRSSRNSAISPFDDYIAAQKRLMSFSYQPPSVEVTVPGLVNME